MGVEKVMGESAVEASTPERIRLVYPRCISLSALITD